MSQLQQFREPTTPISNVDSTSPVVASSPSESSHVTAVALRTIIPIALLGAGIAIFVWLADPIEQAKEPPADKQNIRTNVQRLKVEDYQVVVNTNGTVLTYNEVEISSRVGGQIVRISPSFEVGASFQKDDVLVELDSSDYETALDIAEAQVRSATSALELAVLVHDRNKRLFTNKSISEAEVNQAAATRKQAAAELESAKAAVSQSRRDLERTKIRAPFNGRVRLRPVGVGQSIAAGTPLGTVFALDFAEVRLPIAGNELKYLTLPELPGDDPVDVELRDAIDKDSPNVWPAKIVRTEGTLSADSLELFAIARIDDPFGAKSGLPPLRPGQPVVASIAGSVLRDAVSLPRSAVRQLDQIFLVDKTDLVLAERTITPIWRDEDSVIVQDPRIHDGALLATTQLVYAPNGAKVEIIPDINTAESTTATTATKSAAK